MYFPIRPRVQSIFKEVLKRYYSISGSSFENKSDPKATRNVGIIAHIDAGKTTTTERMLFYSGQTSVMGEVHDGDTVTDYLPQERERGITITSASITFDWKRHRINLIDTPGHVDFTIEVERALSVLDGAVTILDASAGVEAQTHTVWHQANRYTLPRIIYLNKMDRRDVDIDHCLHSIERKLNVKPLPIHIPLYNDKHFHGVIDLITMESHVWPSDNTDEGRNFITTAIKPANPDYERCKLCREELIGSLSDMDEKLCEEILSSDSVEDISLKSIQNALRRATIKQLAYPILCGSSYKNIGVQLLLDSICRYFPSPLEKVRHIESLYSDKLCAFAFKIVFDKQWGCLTFLRIYSGQLKSSQTIYNINREKSEKIQKLFIAFADQFREVSDISGGNIAVVTGLVHTITGDTLVVSQSVANDAKRKCKATDSGIEPIFAGISVPEPVFYCSIEAPSLSKLKDLDLALNNLQREDPSFKVSADKDSGQTVIKGMGELHIDVIKDRILKEYGVDAYLGPLQVSYRETITEAVIDSIEVNKLIAGTKNKIKLQLELKPKSMRKHSDSPLVRVRVTQENDLGKLREDHLRAIETGVRNALEIGPILSFPVIDACVDLLWFETTSRTTIPMISSTVTQCVAKSLLKASPQLLEPFMRLEITTPEQYIGSIINDLSLRRSQIGDTQVKADFRVINALTPLSELVNYSTYIRTLTSGTASFTMEFDSYRHMSDAERNEAIQKMTGFRIN